MFKHRLKIALGYYERIAGEGNHSLTPEEASLEKERLLIQIGFFQHERLIHLIVTVLFGIATIIMIPFNLLTHEPALLLLSGMLLILLVPYIVHYYHLENGVQQLYLYYNRLELMALPGSRAIY